MIVGKLLFMMLLAQATPQDFVPGQTLVGVNCEDSTLSIEYSYQADDDELLLHSGPEQLAIDAHQVLSSGNDYQLFWHQIREQDLDRGRNSLCRSLELTFDLNQGSLYVFHDFVGVNDASGQTISRSASLSLSLQMER